MYYEEKFIDKILMFRTMPDGYWLPKDTSAARVANNAMQLTDEERLELFGYFCTHCGAADPKCVCWRDE